MRPAEEVAREWLDADGPSDEDMARYVRDNFFDLDAYEHARVTALIVAARREGAEEMRERAYRATNCTTSGNVNLDTVRRTVEIAAAIRALPLTEESADATG